MPNVMNSMSTNAQWRTRPHDQRHLDMDEVLAKTLIDKEATTKRVATTKEITFRAENPQDVDSRLLVQGPNGVEHDMQHLALSQVAGMVQAPADYLRRLPAALAADNLNYLLQTQGAEEIGLLVRDHEESHTCRSIRSARYGLIHDYDYAKVIADHFGDGRTGRFRVPGEFGKDVPITRENTTLYAGNNNMFLFLADEHNKVEMPNRRDGKDGAMSTGLYFWNGIENTIGFAMFLFDYVCCNRIVWSMTDYQEVSFRHSYRAPHKWQEEMLPLIEQAVTAKPDMSFVKAIEDARAAKINGDVLEYLTKRYNRKQAQALIAVHETEEHRPIETLWDLSTAITAKARSIPYQDERITLEMEAGKVLKLAA